MVLGIDASRAFLLKRTGIEEYSYQVIKQLRNELAEEQVVLYVRKQSVARSQQSGGNVCDFDIPKTWEVKELWGPRLWTQVRLAIEIWLHPPDVFFAPAHTVPWIHPKETIVTVHGLEYEFCPEAYSWWERCYMRWSIKHSCRWASKIIAVSENTKRDLMKLYGVPEEKISVIYEGVEGGELGMKNEELGRNSKFQIQNFKLQINSKFQISKPYFLFIGRIEARKNVARMIEAFDMFKRKCGTEHKLVLAGKPGFGYEKIEHSSDVLELGYVSGEEKWELLWSAEGFLFPSLYEGFGLPVLEAQAVGVPVLTSTTSSLPEIACHVARERRDEEKCAVFVDPLDVEDIALGIEKLALDRGFRSAIIEGGLRNVKRFSWETCAKKIATLLLYGNTSRFSGIWKKKYREGSLGA